MQRRLIVLFALVGCGGGDRVPVYNGPSFTHDPPPVGSMSGKIVVTDNGDDTLSIVDPAAPGPAKRLPVGFNPVEIEGPHHLSVDPAGHFLYVNLSMASAAAAAGPHGAHGASVLPGWVLKLDVNGGAEVGRAQVEPNPGDNTLSPDGKILYVTHYDLPRWVAGAMAGDLRKGDSDLVAVDTATMTVKSKTPICPAAHGVRLSADGARLYATCGPDEIAVVDLPAMTVRRVPLVSGLMEGGNCTRCPYALSIAPDGVVWVSSVGSGTTGRGMISQFDPALPGGGDIDQGANVQLLGGALFASFVGDQASYKVYVPVQGGVSGDHVFVYQPQPRGMPPMRIGDIVLDRADCQNAHMMLTDATTGRLVCEGDHVNPGTFVWLDLAATKVIGSVKIGVFPDGLALVKAP